MLQQAQALFVLAPLLYPHTHFPKMRHMSTSCKKQSNLARSLNALYDNQLTEGESQSASRYLVDFFKILDTMRRVRF